jgi:hypothetical protein
MLALASIAMTASGRFAMYAATRSPRLTPSVRKCAATLATRARRSRHETSIRSPRSLTNTSAAPEASCSSRLAAKLSFAPSNHVAPGIRDASRSTVSYGANALISQNRQTAAQNSSGDSMLQS